MAVLVVYREGEKYHKLFVVGKLNSETFPSIVYQFEVADMSKAEMQRAEDSIPEKFK